MCSSHRSGVFALGVIHLTNAIMIAVAQGSITTYLEYYKSPIARYMNISPGLWLAAVLIITGSLAVTFAKKQNKNLGLAIAVVFFCIISILMALVVIYFDAWYLSDYKKWMWRKQRYTNDPNPLIDAEFNLYHQLLRNRLDIEALFIMGGCLMGLTVLEVVTLTITIAVTMRFLCFCCSESAFVKDSESPKPRTTRQMVNSRDNSKISLPLMITDL